MYHSLWIAMQDDPELTAVVRSRQLHIYRDGKKVLILTGKSARFLSVQTQESPLSLKWLLML